jgi:hypothetical protein
MSVPWHAKDFKPDSIALGNPELRHVSSSKVCRLQIPSTHVVTHQHLNGLQRA